MESSNTPVKKNKKKKWIILGIILAVVVIIGVVSTILIRNTVKKVKEAMAAAEQETVYVQKMDLESTLSATGSLISSEETTATAAADASTYPVKELKVKVGDTIARGDVLYTLDMSALETELANAKQQLAITQQQNDLSINSATRSASTTQSSGEKQLLEAANSVQSATENVNAANAAVDDAKAALDKDPENETLKKTYASKKEALEAATRTLNEALADQTATINSVNAANASSQESITNAQLSAQSSVLSAQASIAKMEATLKLATVTAASSGTVTAVNVTVGSSTGNVIISNTTQLKASVSIDEASINKIKEGMKVIIKTDATGDEKLEGTVVFISPTPTKSSGEASSSSSTASVSTSRATYRVDVALTEPNDNLRLGMTAKMSFILASAADVFAVPTDYISTAADGSKYITVLESSDNSTRTITVTTGMENDYYTEISGDGLSAGQQLVSTSASADSADAVLENSGALGGITD